MGNCSDKNSHACTMPQIPGYGQKITRYRDIPKFTDEGRHTADMEPRELLEWIAKEEDYGNLELNPDFQRGHVWTPGQQKAYITHIMRGGYTGRDLYFNCPWWDEGAPCGDYREYVCVDGLQRITAWKAFLHDEIEIFGSTYSEFTDRWPTVNTMRIHVNSLKTRKEVLRWYIEMNAGGTPHSEEEIERVRRLMTLEK